MYEMSSELAQEMDRFAELKKRQTMVDEDEEVWRQAIRVRLEQELSERVRDALHTPAATTCYTHNKLSRRDNAGDKFEQQLQRAFDMKIFEGDMRQYRRLMRQKIEQTRQQPVTSAHDHVFRRRLSYDMPRNTRSAALHDRSPAPSNTTLAAQDDSALMTSAQRIVEDVGERAAERFTHLYNKVAMEMWRLTDVERYEFYYMFSREGYWEAVRTGRLPDGSKVEWGHDGRYVDCFGIQRTRAGPFWPLGHGPLFAAPLHHRYITVKDEPLAALDTDSGEVAEELHSSLYPGVWSGASRVVYDTSKAAKDQCPYTVPDNICPSLVFESRFESANLRQAKRTGQFDYELILNTDLYTTRHTQWYYFRVQNAVPGVTYRFKIINLLKKDSLYNYGMRPLLYSDNAAKNSNTGWVRAGHHIRYYKNSAALFCNLLNREKSYYTLEWQMEFPSANDTCYLAHSYPYTFSDLCSDLDILMADPSRSRHVKKEVMCETKAGNSCFLLTITNTDEQDKHKKGVVISARVHCGETNSSWTMKGLLDFLTGHSTTAHELRKRFIFKVVPMLNPDGVIIGNYRCDLTGRDLNRNYRHPRRDNFPTVWNTKAMAEELARTHGVVLYCDLHGHSRKQNVFMYGCPRKDLLVTEGSDQLSEQTEVECFLHDRLFPWLMAKRSPERFCFDGCKFQMRRSKEATGRVVMFRQVRIVNSFTMEATFCGTVLDRKRARHFSTQDFQEMGRTLCEVVLHYNTIMADERKLAEVLAELTSAIAHRILMQSAMQVKYEPLNITAPTTTQAAAAGEGVEVSGGCSSGACEASVSRLCENFLTTPTSKTVADCVHFLQELDNTHSIAESSSSDSDSEPEPEVKVTGDECRRRKKKKSNKKNRKNTCATKENTETPEVIAGEEEVTKVRYKSGKLHKTFPRFINPYDKRSNGGIPCFTEERMMERAKTRHDRHISRALQQQYLSESPAEQEEGVMPLSSEVAEEKQAEETGYISSEPEEDLQLQVRRMQLALTPHAAPVHISPFLHPPPHGPTLQHRSMKAETKLAPLSAPNGVSAGSQTGAALTANGIVDYCSVVRLPHKHRGFLSHKDTNSNHGTVKNSLNGALTKDYAESFLNRFQLLKRQVASGQPLKGASQ